MKSSERQLVKAFAEIIEGERQRIKKIAQETPERLDEETYKTRTIFNLVMKNGEKVVDEWINGH